MLALSAPRSETVLLNIRLMSGFETVVSMRTRGGIETLGLGISKLKKVGQSDLIPCLREMLTLPPPGSLGMDGGDNGEFGGVP